MPIQVGDDDTVLLRMIAGRPVIVAGDGTSLWTLTRSVDFAQPFVRLLGNSGALNDDFQITGDRGFTWDQIYQAIARGFGVEAKIVHVPTDTLVRYNPDWVGPLLGDKSWSALFDNSKVKGVAGPFTLLGESRRDSGRLDHAREEAPSEDGRGCGGGCADGPDCRGAGKLGS